MDERVASAIAHWAPRFTTNGVTVADFQRVTGARRALGGLVRRLVGVARRARGLGRQRSRRGPAAVGRRAPRAGGGVLPLRASSSSSRTWTRCAPRTSGRCLPRPTRCRTSTRPGAGSRCPSRAPRWSASCGCPHGDGPAPGRRPAARPGLDQGGAALDRGDLPRPRPGDLQRRRPRPGRGGVRPADPRRLVGPGRGDLVDARRPTGGRRRPGRRVGREPRRLLRPAGGRGARRPGPGLRRAGRALRLRRVLGRSCPS